MAVVVAIVKHRETMIQQNFKKKHAEKKLKQKMKFKRNEMK